jgi:hypothetical protein
MDEAPSSYDPMLDRPLGPGLRLYTLVMTLLLLFAHGSAYVEPPPGAGALFLGLPGQAQPAAGQHPPTPWRTPTASHRPCSIRQSTRLIPPGCRSS